ncbi:hypothetical protein MLD56_16275 [Paenibacillus peoriae]|uniref:hypothetical protein n=1 Tax=Paenibacillus peoriae TaxID=59893 RepID=UPI001F13BA86|nr:hypothetical protein [Paenibacillus peoriae]UMY53130.1 hypothetical protein MLD56_16275 [Paenibacillus peoriae]
MKKSTKWVLWLLGLIFGGIVLNFYLNFFSVAYALIGLLLAFFSGWGAIVKLKNDVNQYEDHYKRQSYVEDDIEKYTK